MRTTTPLRRALIAVTATAAVVLTATGSAVAVPVSGAASAPHAAAFSRSPLYPVVESAAERLATADLVAAAKWGTDSPIDDPAREQQVLDNVAAQATQLGADPDEIRTIFRDQIEANKVVQRGLFRRWTDHPDQAPTTRPDLSVVRRQINEITTALVQSLADTSEKRDSIACRPELTLAAFQVHHENHLDTLHTRALIRALPSICGT